MKDSDFLPLRTRRLISGGLFAAIAGAGWWSLRADRASFTTFVMPSDPGPFALAAMCLAVVGVAGLILVGIGLGTRPSAAPAGSAEARYLLPLLFLGSILAMPLMMSLIGTTAAVMLFAVVWILLLDIDLQGFSTRGLIRALIFGLLAGGTIYLLFIRILNVPLPD